MVSDAVRWEGVVAARSPARRAWVSSEDRVPELGVRGRTGKLTTAELVNRMLRTLGTGNAFIAKQDTPDDEE